MYPFHFHRMSEIASFSFIYPTERREPFRFGQYEVNMIISNANAQNLLIKETSNYSHIFSYVKNFMFSGMLKS